MNPTRDEDSFDESKNNLTPDEKAIESTLIDLEKKGDSDEHDDELDIEDDMTRSLDDLQITHGDTLILECLNEDASTTTTTSTGAALNAAAAATNSSICCTIQGLLSEHVVVQMIVLMRNR